MNFTGLTNSTAASTTSGLPPDAVLQDLVVFYGSYVGSAVCGLGFFTSIVCIVVFAQPELKGILFKYYLTESVLNALSALISTFFVWYNIDWSVTRTFGKADN